MNKHFQQMITVKRNNQMKIMKIPLVQWQC